jgi:tetratricopeptide (TPR) repeat protein/transcriptional regulator with XRE-family HTH domain
VAVPAEERFGKLLRRLRADAGFTQEELAEAAGVSYRSISDLERGINLTARKDTARLLADGLRLEGETRKAFEMAARGRAVVPGPWPGRAAASAMRTLPRDVANFSGREMELARLVDAAGAAAYRGGVIGIHAIGGMAGIGKTTLAVHAAHRLADHFPDGQVFLRLHAHTPGQSPLDPADALASLLLTVGLSAAQVPDGMEARIACWRDYMADKRLLLILDDASSHEQVRPLLPSGSASMVLVTSRRHLTALDDATAISLDVLPAVDAAVLFARMADRAALIPDDQAIARIVRLCGYLPLAIGMLARQLHHHPAWTTGDLAAELTEARDRLELMRTENLSVAAAFDLSYAELTTSQQLLFRRLGLFPGQDVDVYVAAALADIGRAEARQELGELYDQHLLSEPARGRYRLHDLLRAHARTLAVSDGSTDSEAAVSRLMAYYLHAARLADLHIAPYGRPETAGHSQTATGPRSRPEHPALSDRDHAQVWLTAERENLMACVGEASTTQDYRVMIGITAALATYLRICGPWTRAVDLHMAAVAAASQVGDRLAEASARTELGVIRQLTGDYPGASAELEKALDIYCVLENRLGQANALLELGNVRRLRSEYTAAAQMSRRALDLYRDVDDPRGQAGAFRQLGKVLCIADDYQGAAVALEQAVTLSRYLRDAVGESAALAELGVVRYATDDNQAAIAALKESLELSRSFGDRFGQGFPLLQLGVVLRTIDDYSGAMSALESAMEIFDEFGNKIGVANVWSNMGNVHAHTGDYEAAGQALERALAIYHDLGHQLGIAHALNDLGKIQYLTGDLASAADLLDQSMSIYRALGHSHGESSVLSHLGVVSRLAGDYPRAARLLEQALSICRDLGDKFGEAQAQNYIGDLQRLGADAKAALASYERALELGRLVGSQYLQAQAMEGLGRSELFLGHSGPALEALEQALEIYQNIGAAEAARLASELMLTRAAAQP